MPSFSVVILQIWVELRSSGSLRTLENQIAFELDSSFRSIQESQTFSNSYRKPTLTFLLTTAEKCIATDIFGEHNLKRECCLTIITNIWVLHALCIPSICNTIYANIYFNSFSFHYIPMSRYYYPSFTDGDAETKGDEVSCPSHTP